MSASWCRQPVSALALWVKGLTEWTCSETVSENTPIPPPDWEALISQIAKEIVEERSPARIMQVRAKLYDLLTHCIPPTTIIKVWLRLTLNRFIWNICTDWQSCTSDTYMEVDPTLR